MSILGLVVLTSACDSNTSKQDQQHPASDKVTTQEVKKEQPLKLQFKLETLDVKIPKCEGQLCPDIKIQRLDSNFPELDEAVDRYIYSYMSGFLQGFDLPESAKHQESDPQLENKAQTTSPVKEIKNSEKREVAALDKTQALPSAKDSLLQKIQPEVDKFIALYHEVKSLGSSSQLSVYLRPQVLNPQSPVTTVVMNANNYIGGAHGSSAQQYINFELASKKVLNLEAILQQGKRKALSDVVHKQFQAWVKETQPDMDLKLYEDLWSFKLSDNFYLSPQGLILQYGEYEIGPYVVGLPRFTVPYAELSEIIKPQYIPVITAKPLAQSSSSSP